MDYVDLLLIHWPNPDQNRYVDAWRGLLKLFEQGRVRAIGTSNFKPAHLDRLLAETGQLPDVNQIQVNPDVARSAPRAYHDDKGIVTMAWSPLGGSRTDLFTRPTITEIAERHGKSPAQIVLRWHLELGTCAGSEELEPRATGPEPRRLRLCLDRRRDAGAVSARSRRVRGGRLRQVRALTAV